MRGPIRNVCMHESLHHARLTKSNISSTELASSYGVTNEVLFQIAAPWDPLDYLPQERETENKQKIWKRMPRKHFRKVSRDPSKLRDIFSKLLSRKKLPYTTINSWQNIVVVNITWHKIIYSRSKNCPNSTRCWAEIFSKVQPWCKNLLNLLIA